jgi:hypothetical protein
MINRESRRWIVFGCEAVVGGWGVNVLIITIHNPPFDSPTLSSSKKKRAPPKFVNLTYTKVDQNK